MSVPVFDQVDHDWYIYKQDANKHYWRCDCGNNGWGNDHFDNNNTGKCDDCGSFPSFSVKSWSFFFF